MFINKWFEGKVRMSGRECKISLKSVKLCRVCLFALEWES